MISFKGFPCVYAAGPDPCEEGFCPSCPTRQKFLPTCKNNTLNVCTHGQQDCVRCQVGVEWAGKMAEMQERFTPEQGPQTPLSNAEEIE